MAAIPNITFPRGEHYAFFFQDTHLILIHFERDHRRLLFLVQEAGEDGLKLDFSGDLFEAQVRDAIDLIFFVELGEEGTAPKNLVLGAYFPVGNEIYGAYYERGGEEQTLFFLRIVGEGDTIGLEAVEEKVEYELVVKAFQQRYAGVLSV